MTWSGLLKGLKKGLIVIGSIFFVGFILCRNRTCSLFKREKGRGTETKDIKTAKEIIAGQSNQLKQKAEEGEKAIEQKNKEEADAETLSDLLDKHSGLFNG